MCAIFRLCVSILKARKLKLYTKHVMSSCLHVYIYIRLGLRISTSSQRAPRAMECWILVLLFLSPKNLFFSLLSSASLHYTSRRPPPRMFNDCFFAHSENMDGNSMNFCACIYPPCEHHSESLCVKSGEIFRAENQNTSMRGDDEILRTCSVHTFSSCCYCCYSSPKSSTWLNFHSHEFSLLTHTNSSLPPQITCLPRFNSFFFYYTSSFFSLLYSKRWW